MGHFNECNQNESKRDAHSNELHNTTLATGAISLFHITSKYKDIFKDMLQFKLLLFF